MERRILNVFPRVQKEGDRWFSVVTVEATALPRRVEIQPVIEKVDMQRSDKDPSLFCTLLGLRLAMAEDSILVTDGLIRRVAVKEGEGNDNSHQKEPESHLVFTLEHPVMPRVNWYRPKLSDDEKTDWPYVIEFAFPREALSRLFAGKKIAIDPGHGGKDEGVKGPVNLLEKNVAMEVSQILSSLLSDSGSKVLLSRENDVYLSPLARTAWARKQDADVLVKIHTSRAKDPMAQEYHVKAKGSCPDSFFLASLMIDSLKERLGVEIPEVELMEDDPSLPPTIHVEPLCLSHFVDEANFRAPLFKKRVAQAIYNGLARYFKSKAESPQEDSLSFLTKSRTEFSVELLPPLPDSLSESSLFGESRVLESLSSQKEWRKATVLRIRTHLITEKDNIVDVVRRYTKGIASKGDIVGISESVLAITQSRAISPDQIRPSLLANILSRFAHPDASISAVRSMQKAIESAGTPRILLAAAAGLFGKLFGIHGLFFRVAGHEVAEIDDSGGTMPPYDRHIILGPKDPMGVAKNIWKKTGLWALILDTNDKGAVDILGTSFPLDPKREEFIKSILRKNPFGNDDQKTPLVVMKIG